MRLVVKIEEAFGAWARFVIRFRFATIALMLSLSLGLGLQLPDLTMDNSTEGFLHADDPTLLLYNEFREQFGRDELILVAMRPREVFDLGFLSKLRALHEDLESEIPHVDEVMSLVNARVSRASEGELVVEELLGEWPADAAELVDLKRRVLSNPWYRNLLISEDGRFTVIAVTPAVYSSRDEGAEPLAGFEHQAEVAPDLERRFLSEDENAAVVASVREIAARFESPDLAIHVAGAPVLIDSVNRSMRSDVERFALLGMATVAACLFLVFRRVSGVVLPTLVVGLSVVSLLGIMALMRIPLSIVNEILPAFLLTVGVCDSVHILVIVYQRLSKGDSRHEAIVHALRYSGLAVLMTSLTTAAGLLSFSTAALAPIANLGVLAPIGVMLALVYSLTLLPAVLAVMPLRTCVARAHPLAVDVLVATGDLATRHPMKVIGVSVALLSLAAWGILQLRFSHYPMRWFPENEPLRIATEVIDRELKGSEVLEVLVDTGEREGLHEPEVLEHLERMGAYAESVEGEGIFGGRSVSMVGIVKEIHQALNEGRREYYVIPPNRQVVAQELLLFENSGADDLAKLADTELSRARLTLKVRQGDAMVYPAALAEIEERFQEDLGQLGEVRVTGLMALLGRTFQAVVTSLGRSYVLAFVMITPMMVLLLGGLVRGLVAMIPNVIPVILILGIMAWADIPVDGVNLMLGAIILGLAVDDTIHFMHKFGIHLEESGDAGVAVRRTLETTGVALLYTSIVLSSGFFIFMLGHMVSVFYLGLLAGVATILAFLADIVLAPALMVLVSRPTVSRA